MGCGEVVTLPHPFAIDWNADRLMLPLLLCIVARQTSQGLPYLEAGFQISSFVTHHPISPLILQLLPLPSGRLTSSLTRWQLRWGQESVHTGIYMFCKTSAFSSGKRKMAYHLLVWYSDDVHPKQVYHNRWVFAEHFIHGISRS